MKALPIIKIVIGLSVIIALLLWGIHKIDEPVGSCLDQGGCWDSIDKICRKNEPNSQDLCWRSETKESCLKKPDPRAVWNESKLACVLSKH